MIAKGQSISHGAAALEYDLAKRIDGNAAAEEVCRNGVYGTTGADIVQEMQPYFADFPNVKNTCLRFEVSPSVEESASMKPEDWRTLASDFLSRMGLTNHQYVAVRHSGTETRKNQAHLHILVNRVSLSGELYRDNWIGKRATEAANGMAKERNYVQSQDIGLANRQDIKSGMDAALRKLERFDFGSFKEEMGKNGYPIREARASTGKLNGYYVKAKSGTEYKASEIGKGYTLANIEKTHFKLHKQTLEKSYGKSIISGKGGLHL